MDGLILSIILYICFQLKDYVLDYTYEFDGIKIEKPTIEKYNRSNLIFRSK